MIRTGGAFSSVFKRRGFTLIELAIVLLVAGILIGAVWAGGDMVREDYEASRTAQQVVKIVQNIREYFMNMQSLANLPAPYTVTANKQDITATLDTFNLFPVEMRRTPTAGPGGGPIDNPFNNQIAGGSFLVAAVKNCPNLTALTYTCFYVRVLGLYPDACIRLLHSLPVEDADLGIVGILAQYGAGGFVNVAAGNSPAPAGVSPTTAETWCNQAGNANEVDWEFKLHN